MGREGEIFFLLCLFSAMVPEPVLPSPPFDGGLLGDEEVNTMRFLEFLQRGGSVVLPLSQPSWLTRMAVIA